MRPFYLNVNTLSSRSLRLLSGQAPGEILPFFMKEFRLMRTTQPSDSVALLLRNDNLAGYSIEENTLKTVV